MLKFRSLTITTPLFLRKNSKTVFLWISTYQKRKCGTCFTLWSALPKISLSLTEKLAISGPTIFLSIKQDRSSSQLTFPGPMNLPTSKKPWMKRKSLTFLLKNLKSSKTTKCKPSSTQFPQSLFPLAWLCFMLACSLTLHPFTTWKNAKSIKNYWMKKFKHGWNWILLMKTMLKPLTAHHSKKSSGIFAFSTVRPDKKVLKYLLFSSPTKSLSSTSNLLN